MWVLTGDKIETAINIGLSCDLLNTTTETFIIDELKTKEIVAAIERHTKKMNFIKKKKNNAVVVAGETLAKI